MLVDFSLKVVHREKKNTTISKKNWKKNTKKKDLWTKETFLKTESRWVEKGKGVFFCSFLGGSHARHCPPEITTKKTSLLVGWKKKTMFWVTKGRVQFRLNHGGKSNPLHKSIRILIFAYFSLRWRVESVSFCLHYEERDFQTGKSEDTILHQLIQFLQLFSNSNPKIGSSPPGSIRHTKLPVSSPIKPSWISTSLVSPDTDANWIFMSQVHYAVPSCKASCRESEALKNRKVQSQQPTCVLSLIGDVLGCNLILHSHFF